jgi:hypothetical protein
MSHTAGPWYLSTTGRYVRYDGIRGPNICDLEVFGGPPEEGKANANLICAAPDLLAACEAVLYSPTHGDTPSPEAVEMVRSAVALAKGGV